MKPLLLLLLPVKSHIALRVYSPVWLSPALTQPKEVLSLETSMGMKGKPWKGGQGTASIPPGKTSQAEPRCPKDRARVLGWFLSLQVEVEKGFFSSIKKTSRPPALAWPAPCWVYVVTRCLKQVAAQAGELKELKAGTQDMSHSWQEPGLLSTGWIKAQFWPVSSCCLFQGA